MSVIKNKEETNYTTAKDLTALNKTIITNLVPQIIHKDDLVTLFKDMLAPMSDALEKSEKAITEARPPRPTRQNPK